MSRGRILASATPVAILALLVSWPACGSGRVGGSIRIDSISTEEQSVEIRAIIENTGQAKHEFPVGCSLKRRDESWKDIRHQKHELKKGEKKVVVFRADEIDTRDFVLVRAAIWDREKPDGMLETRYDMDERILQH